MNVKNSTNTWSSGGVGGPKDTRSNWEGATRPPVQPDAQLQSTDTSDTFTSKKQPPVNLTGTSTT